MRVLITGGYGCIGAWICKQLLERGDAVWVYDLKEDPRRLRLVMPEEQLRRVAFIQGDVTDLAGLRRAIDTNAITHLIHLAGLQVPVCRANPILGAQVNVVGTLAVFEAVRLAKQPVQRLVYASSAAVFGPPPVSPRASASADSAAALAKARGETSISLNEDDNLIPSTHYGIFKLCNEGNARIYYQDFGLSSIGLRPWTVYGVGRDFGMTSEPTKAIKSVALGRKYAISYGGWQDLQLVEDVAAIFVRCLERPYQGAKSYNLRGHVVDLQTFHRALCAVAPEAKDLVTYGDRQIAIAYDLDDGALQRDLGPMPLTPLEEGIRRTLAHFRKLRDENRLDTADLDAPAAPVVTADEP